MALPTTMRTIRIHKFGGPEVLQLESVPVPQAQKNQVLVRVKAIGVNPVETFVRTGQFPGHTSLPRTPGSDAAGVIAAVGTEVSKFKVGDRVFVCDTHYITGSYAEYMLVAETRTFLLPETLSFGQGAALGVPYFSALRALRHKAHAKAGERVLIHGASGGVGIAAVQIAAAWKLDVVGTASSADGTKLVKEAGARLVLNHRDANHKENLKKATDGKGFDVVVEMAGQANLAVDLEVAAQLGRVVVIGGHGDVPISLFNIMFKETLVTGIILSSASDQDWKEMGEDIAKLLKDGAIKPVIDEAFPLEKAPEAHIAVMDSSRGSKGKIVLLV